MQPDLPLATVAFVPRETFCQTRAAFDALLENTETPYDLICVDGGSPAQVRDYLAAKARELGFTLLRSEGFLTPNQARNIAVGYVRTKYVAFIDNDAFPAPGWLSALVSCAEETGAWAVGPLYFEHEPRETFLHMAGGECRIVPKGDGTNTFVEEHTHGHKKFTEVGPFERQETELLEFHTMLVAMKVFDALGPLDEALTCTFEHCDLCLAIRSAGKKVFLEPAARITYVPPRKLDAVDDAFFQFRWSEASIDQSFTRLEEKYAISRTDERVARRRYWLRHHRRHRLTGLHRLRKVFGRGAYSLFEAGIVIPLDNAISRWRFRGGKAGSAARVEQVFPGAAAREPA